MPKPSRLRLFSSLGLALACLGGLALVHLEGSKSSAPHIPSIPDGMSRTARGAREGLSPHAPVEAEDGARTAVASASPLPAANFVTEPGREDAVRLGPFVALDADGSAEDSRKLLERLQAFDSAERFRFMRAEVARRDPRLRESLRRAAALRCRPELRREILLALVETGSPSFFSELLILTDPKRPEAVADAALSLFELLALEASVDEAEEVALGTLHLRLARKRGWLPESDGGESQ